MRLPWRDSLASLFVAIAVTVYVAWAAGAALPGFGSVAAVAVAVGVLGLVGCVPAVVQGFDALLHGSRFYLAAASALGLAALGTGLWAIAAGEPIALALLVVATVILWAMSTLRHVGSNVAGQRLGHL